ncbi:MAG: hypothetical protein VYB38_14425 [Bacteroidota bacterium]|nr:hypothetical protein [Bacteroidota bacterium]MEE3149291.1 hypothetical protein [Bacteroidota bacterium]MEE3244139.1 hypothetical protein [Bacteroidota bacterium]
MSTTKTAEKAQTAKANNKTTLKKAEDQKPQEAKSTTTIKDIVNPTAQSRIQKIKNFEILANKHNFLTNKKQELEQFIISNDGTKEKLSLSNVNGYKFEVSNSQVLEKVVELLDAELTTFLEKSEKDILAYSI